MMSYRCTSYDYCKLSGNEIDHGIWTSVFLFETKTNSSDQTKKIYYFNSNGVLILKHSPK